MLPPGSRLTSLLFILLWQTLHVSIDGLHLANELVSSSGQQQAPVKMLPKQNQEPAALRRSDDDDFNTMSSADDQVVDPNNVMAIKVLPRAPIIDRLSRLREARSERLKDLQEDLADRLESVRGRKETNEVYKLDIDLPVGGQQAASEQLEEVKSPNVEMFVDEQPVQLPPLDDAESRNLPVAGPVSQPAGGGSTGSVSPIAKLRRAIADVTASRQPPAPKQQELVLSQLPGQAGAMAPTRVGEEMAGSSQVLAAHQDPLNGQYPSQFAIQSLEPMLTLDEGPSIQDSLASGTNWQAGNQDAMYNSKRHDFGQRARSPTHRVPLQSQASNGSPLGGDLSSIEPNMGAELQSPANGQSATIVGSGKEALFDADDSLTGGQRGQPLKAAESYDHMTKCGGEVEIPPPVHHEKKVEAHHHHHHHHHHHEPKKVEHKKVHHHAQPVHLEIHIKGKSKHKKGKGKGKGKKKKGEDIYIKMHSGGKGHEHGHGGEHHHHHHGGHDEDRKLFESGVEDQKSLIGDTEDEAGRQDEAKRPEVADAAPVSNEAETEAEQTDKQEPQEQADKGEEHGEEMVVKKEEKKKKIMKKKVKPSKTQRNHEEDDSHEEHHEQKEAADRDSKSDTESMGHGINTSEVPSGNRHQVELYHEALDEDDHSKHYHHHYHKHEHVKKHEEHNKPKHKEKKKQVAAEEKQKELEEEKKVEKEAEKQVDHKKPAEVVHEKKEKHHHKKVEEVKHQEPLKEPVKEEPPKEEPKKEEEKHHEKQHEKQHEKHHEKQHEKQHEKHHHDKKSKHQHFELHQHKHFENHQHINLNQEPEHQVVEHEPQQLDGPHVEEAEGPIHEAQPIEHHQPIGEEILGGGGHYNDGYDHGHGHRPALMPIKEEWIAPIIHEKVPHRGNGLSSFVIEDHSEIERHRLDHPIEARYQEEVINNPHGKGLSPSGTFHLLGAYSTPVLTHAPMQQANDTAAKSNGSLSSS